MTSQFIDEAEVKPKPAGGIEEAFPKLGGGWVVNGFSGSSFAFAGINALAFAKPSLGGTKRAFSWLGLC